MNEHNKMLY